MSLRATLLLLALAVGLGGWVYFYEIVGKAEKAEQESADKKLLQFESEQVSALVLPLEEGGQARLQRDADDPESWRLETPRAGPADAVVVKGILSALAELEAEATLERPADLAPFGLDAQRAELQVLAGDAEPRVLWIGGEAPVGATHYLALASDEAHVFTVASGRVRGLRPGLNGLRDKRITRLAPSDVVGFSLREKGALVVAARQVSQVEKAAEADEPDEPDESDGAGEEEGGTPAAELSPHWELLQPFEDRADDEQLRRAIESVGYARATSFVDEPAALADYGLASPELELVLERAGAEPQRIELGRAGEKAFARVDGGLPLFELPARVLDELPRELFAYRFKRVLRLDELATRRLELEFPRDAAHYVFTRDDAEWKPLESDVRVESLEIEDILYAIRDLEAIVSVEASFSLAQLGLEPARVRVTARDADGAQLGWLELGDPDGEGIAARSSQSKRLWRVATDLGREVPLGLEAFRNRWLKPDAPAPAPPPPDEPLEEETGEPEVP